jgi:hypothetical protein
MIAREIFDQLPSLSAAITCDAEAIGELVEKQCEGFCECTGEKFSNAWRRRTRPRSSLRSSATLGDKIIQFCPPEFHLVAPKTATTAAPIRRRAASIRTGMAARNQARRLPHHGAARQQRRPPIHAQRIRFRRSLPADCRGGNEAQGALLLGRRPSWSMNAASPPSTCFALGVTTMPPCSAPLM